MLGRDNALHLTHSLVKVIIYDYVVILLCKAYFFYGLAKAPCNGLRSLGAAANQTISKGIHIGRRNEYHHRVITLFLYLKGALYVYLKYNVKACIALLLNIALGSAVFLPKTHIYSRNASASTIFINSSSVRKK